MPKINVYLPDDMAAQVREAKLSVSPVCQQAIRKELDRWNAQREATRDIHAVAARLQGTISEEEAEGRKDGYADGVEWAREWATASELREFTDANLDLDLILREHSIVDFRSSKEGALITRLSIKETPYWNGCVDGAGEVLTRVESLL